MTDDLQTETVQDPQSETPGGDNLSDNTQTSETLTAEERLEKMQAALKKANKEAETLRRKTKAFEDAQQAAELAKMSELEKAQSKLEALTKERDTLILEGLKTQAAQKYNLPPELAKRLIGTDLETLLEDAEKLAATLPKGRSTPPTGPTNPGGGPPDNTEDQLRALVYGAGGNIFDMNNIKEAGGGVFFPEE